MVNTRNIVFEALLKVYKSEAFSNITLDNFLSKNKLDTRDRTFVSALFYGTIERMITIDYQLKLYLDKPLKKLKPEVLIILRIGAFQILFMDKIPERAAVNECVALAKKNNCAYATGLINAVLRKIAAKGLKLPDDKNITEYLSVKYSIPEEYVVLWMNELGFNKTLQILENTLGSSEIFVRTNTLKTTDDDLIKKLEEENIFAEKTFLKGGLRIDLKGKSPEMLDAYQKGLFHIQDLSCQLCTAALTPEPGQIIFDMCSAPGGKAFTIAEKINDIGVVRCFDIYDSRVKLIQKGAARLGLKSVCAEVSDASEYNENIGLANAVLCDVPCSGLGIIKRKPEIKYKKIDSLADLPEIQYKILCNSSKYVKPGGTLVYSTCTLLNRENIDVCERFLKSHPNFKLFDSLPEYSEKGYITLLPQKNGGDGFFIATFKRTE